MEGEPGEPGNNFDRKKLAGEEKSPGGRKREKSVKIGSEGKGSIEETQTKRYGHRNQGQVPRYDGIGKGKVGGSPNLREKMKWGKVGN